MKLEKTFHDEIQQILKLGSAIKVIPWTARASSRSKIILGTSDAWSTSHLSKQTSVLYLDCQIFGLLSNCMVTMQFMRQQDIFYIYIYKQIIPRLSPFSFKNSSKFLDPLAALHMSLLLSMAVASC